MIIYHSKSFCCSKNASAIQTQQTYNNLRRLIFTFGILNKIRPSRFFLLDRIFLLLFTLYSLSSSLVLLLVRPNAVLYSRDFIVSLILSPLFRSRITYEVHHFSNRYSINLLFSVFSKSNSSVVFISESLRKFSSSLSDYPLPRSKVIPDSHNNVVPSYFDYARLVASRMNSSSLMVGYFGSINNNKASSTLYDLIHGLPSINFIVCSKDNPEWCFESLPNVSFMGFLPHCEVQELMSQCNVGLLLNSLSYFLPDKSFSLSIGTSPLKAFEYISVGLPVVYSDIPANNEILSGTISSSFDNTIPGFLRALDDLSCKAKMSKIIEASHSLAESSTYSSRAKSILGFVSH
jgi:hypothetical protein